MEQVDKGHLMIRMGVRVNVLVLLVTAHPASLGQRSIKHLCLCVMCEKFSLTVLPKTICIPFKRYHL